MSGAEAEGMIGAARCVCATQGFTHPLWNEAYYPPECPVEWRLAYYMNDFPAVYLPAEDWYGQPGQLEAIVEELEEGHFELVLEWPDHDQGIQIEQVLSSIQPLKEHIACIVLDMDTMSESLLLQACEGLNSEFPLNFLCRLPDEGAREIAQKQKAGFIWKPGESDTLIPGGQYQVVSLPCLGLRDIKAVLQLLRPLLEQGVRAGLFLEADRLAPQRALEVRSVIELMGLA